ncbi:ABC transporter permease [Flavobacterium gawalongense]|uniref:ABC transporter permease n=1 Tax=Flavobacterium gawalongense TaxID=2594432 RepID=A0A553BQQ6_9FLAO|nr:ABC transporter permease [Flavobacterium gawalongense]TRW99803.1 ABC transporter permease [Flavobacterium gawalongense]TRX04109.1 ABC transporter permease [Flavobacterium gawalongense]TRX10594.1 ABC transporter permease [Flavobacterium gawalongense]TRX11743.1 ABC transporter permease [Flavobacterium gawalongense]TRX29535.1 ABC transporter permease [Flavobacterium gawalongense]
MSIISLIIKREFIAKVRNKSFIVMTFLSPLLFVGIAAFVGYLSSMKADTKRIAIHDESGLFVKEFTSKNDVKSEYKYLDLSLIDLKFLKDSIANESYQGLLYIPKANSTKDFENKIQFISNNSPSISFIENIQDIVASKLTKTNLVNAHLDTLAIKNAESKVNISLTKASGEESVKGLNEIKIGIGGAFGYLIMMFIIIYGNMVMRSVIEEKTSRIVEIIISSVKPFQLMMGKIIGTALAGLLQFFIWAIIGLSLMFAASVFFGINVGPTARISPELMQAAQQEMTGTAQMYIKELWNLPIASILIGFVIYFIGGYFLYSSFYAAIGAAVDNQTDSQQFLLPIIMPLMLSVYVGFFTVINDPHGTIAVIFSMIPLTSPIVMLMRIPFGVPLWQIAISVTLLFGTFFSVVWFAAKIYRVGILMYGKKPTWNELYRWLKY